jgi:iron complex transport system substrate-binding protein
MNELLLRTRAVKRLLLFASVLAAVVISCGSSSAATPSGTITVVDMAGRTVNVPTDITRLAAIGTTPVLNSMIFLFGKEQALVNGTATSLASLSAFPEQFDPSFANLPVVQASPSTVNPESVLALNPQLVLTNNLGLIEPLQSAGLTVVYVSWQNPNTLANALTVLAKVFDDPAKAAAYTAYLNKTEALVKADLKGVTPASEPTLLSGDPSPLTEPAGSQAHWWASVVGAQNVAEGVDAGKTTNFASEQILAWNPDYIFTQSPAEVTGFVTNPIYADTTAIVKHHVFATPGGFLSWGNSTPEDPLLLLWLARRLHPDQTKNINVEASIVSFYKTFYGFDMTHAEVVGVLTDNINRGS